MRASLLFGIGASVLVACGGNVVVDTPSTGAGAGGTPGTTSTSQSAGPGGALGSCTALSNAFQTAHLAAIACNPGDPPTVCMGMAPDDCGCAQISNVDGSLVQADQDAYNALAAAGCAGECALCSVPSTMFAQCISTSVGYECGEGPG